MLSRILIISLALTLAGCTSVVKDCNLRDYVIDVNSRGQPIDPADHPHTMSIEKFDQQLDRIFDQIQAWNPKPRFLDHGRKRIVIFVHGGLNTPEDSLQRAEETYQQMLDEGIYPIYIIWDSGAFSTYGEHLVWIRQGRFGSNWETLLTPFYLFADLGRAVSRAPLVWYDMLSHDSHRIYADLSAAIHVNQEYRFLDNPEEKTVVRITDGLLARQAAHDPSAVNEISIGGYTGHTGIPLWRITTYCVFFPAKFITTPLLDALGTAMWENMIRRTSVLFEGETANNLREDHLGVEKILDPSDGPLLRLISRLHKLQNPSTGEKSPYNITLIAHSAGAIVVDELIRRSHTVKPEPGDEQQPNYGVKYDTIVYMAAACTVRDFQRTVVPYLSAHQEKDRITQFYNLCLHPVNDLRERHLQDAIPRGSLLVWLDDFLTIPHTPLDRTLGRWDNIVEAAYVIRDVRKQIHLKAFSFNQYGTLEDDSPQEHGDFTEVKFWDPAFRQPETNTMTQLVQKKALQLNARQSTTKPH